MKSSERAADTALSMKPLLSIVIVNYNGKRFLKECLDSVEEFTLSPHEIIVVDNASTDGSREYLKAEFPNVRLVESRENLGFSGGNNLGARRATGELILLLNNDTRFLNSIEPAVMEFDNDERLGALGCRMFYPDMSFQATIGFEATPLRIILSWAGLGRFSIMPDIFRGKQNDPKQYALKQEDVAWVNGAFLMTRKDLWDGLGGLDERFFMYMEDVDYCKGIREMGLRVGYTPEVEMIHYVGSGRAWLGEKAYKDTLKSSVLYIEKHYGKFTSFLVRGALSALLISRAAAHGVVALMTGSAMEKDRAQASLKISMVLLKICK